MLASDDAITRPERALISPKTYRLFWVESKYLQLYFLNGNTGLRWEWLLRPHGILFITILLPALLWMEVKIPSQQSRGNKNVNPMNAHAVLAKDDGLFFHKFMLVHFGWEKIVRSNRESYVCASRKWNRLQQRKIEILFLRQSGSSQQSLSVICPVPFVHRARTIKCIHRYSNSSFLRIYWQEVERL